MKSNRTSQLGALVFLSFLSVATVSCTGKSDDSLTPFKKSTGGKNGGSQKPDKKAIQDALNDKVLVMFNTEKKSVLKAANSKTVVLVAELKINNKIDIGWHHKTFEIKIGENLEAVPLDESHGLGDEKLALSVKAKRIANTNKTGDLGYLVLQYELKQVTDDEETAKHSYMMALLDLNMMTKAKALNKSEVIYPIPEDFSLQDWIDKNIKKP